MIVQSPSLFHPGDKAMKREVVELIGDINAY